MIRASTCKMHNIKPQKSCYSMPQIQESFFFFLLTFYFEERAVKKLSLVERKKES